MNRCSTPHLAASVRRRTFLAGTLLGLLGRTAAAQSLPRSFPPNAQRGNLQVMAPPLIQMNGQADQLSPGARIRGMNNMLLMSGAIIGQTLVVNYVRNPSGQVHDVWVLTDAEAAQKLPTQP